MKLPLRTKLTIWYVAVLAVLLIVYAVIVFAFQYAVLTRQVFHDEEQDVITVEGLLYFDQSGTLQLHQDYYSHPQSHLMVDRMMEVRNLDGKPLYRSPTLNGMALGGPNRGGEGEAGFNERIVRLHDGTYVLLISHIHSMQGRDLLIRLGYSLAPLHARMLQFLLLLLVAVPAALALAALSGQKIAQRALRPLELMAARAEGITASNLHSRLPIEGPDDELGHMARVFNHLLDRLEQAFNQLRRFTADAAHELRTPLASIRTVGEVALQSDANQNDYKDALENILESTSHLNETIESLLLLAKAERTQPGQEHSVFQASDLVEEVLEVLAVVIEERRITVIRDNEVAGRQRVRADRSLLRIALMNVLHNALKFSPSDSILRISYEVSELADRQLIVAIQDQGPGIQPGEHERVFDRFFTSNASTTSSQSGAGLGLSIAMLVIDRANGTIEFDKGLTSGAKCLIKLPITQTMN